MVHMIVTALLQVCFQLLQILMIYVHIVEEGDRIRNKEHKKTERRIKGKEERGEREGSGLRVFLTIFTVNS